MTISASTRRAALFSSLLSFVFFAAGPTAAGADELAQVIERVKPSVVGIGNYQKLRSPALSFIGTGFVVGDGRTVITAAHVVQGLPPAERGGEALGVLIRREGEGAASFRPATILALDKDHDLAALRLEGAALPALQLGDSAKVREGQALAFMGFPLGMVLGLHHVTHRGMVSSITPLATPALNPARLDARLLSQLHKPAYAVFQLDGTAYPGSSGSPLFDPDNGAVVGIVNQVFVRGLKEAAISTPSGITYAIPANFITEMLK